MYKYLPIKSVKRKNEELQLCRVYKHDKVHNEQMVGWALLINNKIVRCYPLTDEGRGLGRIDFFLSKKGKSFDAVFKHEKKALLINIYGEQCFYCGAKNVPLSIDHYIAKSNKGSNDLGNLRLSCFPCNKAKGSLPPKDFEKMLIKNRLNNNK